MLYSVYIKKIPAGSESLKQLWTLLVQTSKMENDMNEIRAILAKMQRLLDDAEASKKRAGSAEKKLRAMTRMPSHISS